jgi:hypothetical protein
MPKNLLYATRICVTTLHISHINVFSLIHFSLYDRKLSTRFQDTTLSGASVAPISEARMTAMFVILMVGN